MIDKDRSLILLRAEKNAIFEACRVFDSDGDVEDEGAADHAGELQWMIDALERGTPDEEILEVARDLSLEKSLRFL